LPWNGEGERRAPWKGDCGGGSLLRGLSLPELVAALDEVLRLLKCPRVDQVSEVARQLAEEENGLGLLHRGRLQGGEVVPHDGVTGVAAHRIIQPLTSHLGGAEAVGTQEELLQLLVRVADGSGIPGQRADISENGSLAKAQWKFVIGWVILAVANMASRQSNHEWIRIRLYFLPGGHTV
jgi:hypothetical protein